MHIVYPPGPHHQILDNHCFQFLLRNTVVPRDNLINLRSGVILFYFIFASLAREGKKKRHKGIIGRGHDLTLPKRRQWLR